MEDTPRLGVDKVGRRWQQVLLRDVPLGGVYTHNELAELAEVTHGYMRVEQLPDHYTLHGYRPHEVSYSWGVTIYPNGEVFRDTPSTHHRRGHLGHNRNNVYVWQLLPGMGRIEFVEEDSDV